MYFEMEDKAYIYRSGKELTVSIENRYGEKNSLRVPSCREHASKTLETTVEEVLCNSNLLSDEELRKVFWVRKSPDGTFLSIDFRDGEQGLWYQPQYRELFEQLAGILEVHVYTPPKRDDMDLHEALSGESLI